MAAIGSIRGKPLEAIPEIEQGMRLDPALSSQFLHFLGMAYLLAGKYETAAALLEQRISAGAPDGFFPCSSRLCPWSSQRVRGGRRVWAELKEINPNYAFADHVGRQPFRRAEDVERIADGLRKARLLS